MNDFLPHGFEELKPVSKYWKPSKMEVGDNKLRILLRPIAGWVDWEDNKVPHRYFPQNKPTQFFNKKGEKGLQRFWATYAWDYKRKGLYILDITQATIIKPLILQANDPEWGNFNKYDITIVRTPRGESSEYNVKFAIPKPLDPTISEALAASPVNLDALYIGEDPWSYFEKVTGDASSLLPSQEKKVVQTISDEEAFQLDDLIGDDEVYRKRMLEHMNIDSINKMPRTAYPRLFEIANEKFKSQPAQSLPF